MIDLQKYADTTILTTSEVARWINARSPKAACRMLYAKGVKPVGRATQYHFLARDVKRALLGVSQEPEEEVPVPSSAAIVSLVHRRRPA
jgi:hypothetical protein